MSGAKRKTLKPSEQAAALVTGAGSGIGRSFAYEIVRRGGSVICADIDRQRAEQTASILSELGEGRAVPYPLRRRQRKADGHARRQGRIAARTANDVGGQ